MAAYHRAVDIKPTYAEAHNNMGVVLQDQGKLAEAITAYHRALEINPAFAEAHNNMGNALKEQGKLAEAISAYHRALEINPAFAEAHYNLGNALRDLGRLEEAETSYRQAIAIKPDYDQAKKGYAECIASMRFSNITPSIYAATATALAEAWTRPTNLSSVACSLLLLNPEINQIFVSDIGTLSNPFQVLYDAEVFNKLSNDPLLLALLTSSPIPDRQLERLLTHVRFLLLDSALKAVGEGSSDASRLTFFCGLAQQCFINEYVFSRSDEELLQATRLKEMLSDALKNATILSPLWVIGVSCYFPLCSVDHSEMLLDRIWPAEINDLLTQQIVEPLEELRLRPFIPLLTPIGDGVSFEVQSQYEENPYPRWIKIGLGDKSMALNRVFRSQFPLVDFQPLGKCDNPKILIAGCGTGQHSMNTSQRFQGAQILAIDLSMASLCYAKRKTQEMGIDNIDYAQADILKLDMTGRTFDIIESVGVLHHLERPFDGWRLLVSLLRPNGFMKLGFYSEIARRDIVRARKLMTQKCYGSTSDEIREARQWLMGIDRVQKLGSAIRSTDFFSLSGCRDLLFHVQENRMTLKQINEFIVDNDLTFLGFEFSSSSTTRAYQLRFPDDRAATSLLNWHVFEQENSDIFLGMYQFWVQKQH